uniref:Fish-egg lectin-like n=1 Tax=Leptobrachium leishanense TaxID=445787 RepID=A0A8C5WMG2_9ANUR
MKCHLLGGLLSQLDAGAGQVYGVTTNDDIFRLEEDSWEHISGKLIHVSVGEVGVWGTNANNEIFKRQNGVWVLVSGRAKQVDAGGNGIVVVVNAADEVFCLNKDQTYSTDTALSFHKLDGLLIYYSCGLYGCWGVNRNNDIFCRLDVTPENCVGSAWKSVSGKMVMLEVGSDGSVFAINTIGNVFKREGISVSHPAGDAWVMLNIPGPFKSLSYDDGVLWLVNQDDNVFKCEDEQSCNSCQNNCQYCQKPLYHL